MKSRTAGFTLIEIVVVVAILGVLSSVAVPRVLGMTAKAEAAVNAANARELTNIAQLIAATTGSLPTWGSEFTTMSTADAFGHLSKAVNFRGSGHFVYDGANGVVSVSSASPPVDPPPVEPPPVLTTLSVGGVSLDPSSTSHTIALPTGTTDVPVVTANAGSGTTVSIVPAASLPGTTTVTVTSSAGTTTYTISFLLEPPAPSDDSSLASLTVGGVTITLTGTTVYTVELPHGTPTPPIVVATASHLGATVGTPVHTANRVTVEVTAENGSSTTYTINYTIAAPAGPSDLESVQMALASIISLNLQNPTGNPAYVLTPPSSTEGITFLFTGVVRLPGQANTNMAVIDGGSRAEVTNRHSNHGRNFELTLQATLNGVSVTKVFIITVPAGTAPITVSPK